LRFAPAFLCLARDGSSHSSDSVPCLLALGNMATKVKGSIDWFERGEGEGREDSSRVCLVSCFSFRLPFLLSLFVFLSVSLFRIVFGLLLVHTTSYWKALT
jgi:hypothetical protein